MDTAILIFSRTAREEAVIKQYGKSVRRNIRIARNLIKHTEAAAHATGFPVIKKYSGSQRGSNFGTRLVNAIEDAFAAGYSRIITIGSDTPGITNRILKKISTELRTAQLVTGPSADGGVYAIGITREAWNKDAFLAIPWLTPAVHEELTRYAAAASLDHQFATELADIDNSAAFNEWLSTAGQYLPLTRIITAITKNGLQGDRTILREQQAGNNIQSARRGPPPLL